jgi:hypothetical protein
VDWTTTWILLALALVILPVLFVSTVGERSDLGATSWPADPADDEAHPRAA